MRLPPENFRFLSLMGVEKTSEVSSSGQNTKARMSLRSWHCPLKYIGKKIWKVHLWDNFSVSFRLYNFNLIFGVSTDSI